MKNFFYFLFFISCISVRAQTTFYTENFTSGGTGWNLASVQGTEGADPNFFTVSDNEGGGLAPGACGVASNGNNTMHVTSVFNHTIRLHRKPRLQWD